MLTLLFKAMAYLPLQVLHVLGGLVGQLMWLLSPSYAQRLRENIEFVYSGTESKNIIKNNILESGKAILELPAIWFRSHQATAKLMRAVHGLDLVEEAVANKRGVILLTPHIGCFEIIPHFLSTKFPFTAMYREPKIRYLSKLMKFGRSREGINLAPADTSGVRMLLKALKVGGVVGILPDQVPTSGDGEWAEFFGRPAYTMVMWRRLAERSGASVFLMHTRRLSNGRGYELFFNALPEKLPSETASDQLNRGIEVIVKQNPSQYLWSYNRFKKPAGSHERN